MQIYATVRRCFKSLITLMVINRERMYIVDQHLLVLHPLILQQLNEAAVLIISCFRDEDM